MSQPKILFNKAKFVRETSGYTQATRSGGAIDDTKLIGTVTSISVSKESEEAVFEKPVTIGTKQKWAAYDAINQKDSEVWTITLSELSPLFWELALGHSTTVPATVYPGAIITHKGWLRLETTDDSGSTISDMYMWCKLDIPSFEFPQTGYVTATVTARKLYSASNSTALANIS